MSHAPRSRSALLRGLFLGLFVAGSCGGLASPAGAVIDQLLLYSGSDFLPSTPSVTGGAVGAFFNPASWSTTDRTEFAFWWNDQNLRGNSLDNWGLSIGRNLGFSVQSRVFPTSLDSTARVEDYQLGLSWGDRRFFAGASWRWSGGDNQYLNRNSGLMLGLITRSSPHFSFGISGFFENVVNPYEGIIDLGIRPFGKPFWSLFGDYSMSEGQSWSDANWGLGTEVRPYRGLHAGVRFQDAPGEDDYEYKLYFGVTLDGLGFVGQPRYRESGGNIGTDYLIRINPPYKGLPLSRALRNMGEPERVVPVSLENKTLDYQKARYFDDRRVSWLGLSTQLEHIKRDESVRGVVLNLSGFRASPALQWELRQKLIDLRQAGKSVYIHGDRMGMGSYYLASVADEISLDPIGNIFLTGMALYRTYMRGFLDKIGLGVEEWRYFNWKTAFQRYSRTDMSEPDREQIGRIVDVLYETWRDGIAEGRRLTAAQVDTLVENEVVLFAPTAMDKGLIDFAGRWPDFQDHLKKDTDAKIRPLAGDRDRHPLYDERWGMPPQVAVVYAVGTCDMDTGIRGRDTSKELQRMARDGDVKAVVLRADSPGGDPLPSDLVADGLTRIKKRNKPAIVSQGRVAGSGGYWISMNGDKVYTTPLTLTGSIGVIAGWVWDENLHEKTGITTDGVQRGSHSDLLRGPRYPFTGISIPHRNVTGMEREMAKSRILEAYNEFVKKVAEGRDLTEEHVRDVGQGRIWMGGDAIERGLCDDFGTLEDAIAEARARAGLKPDEEVFITEYPEPPFLPRLYPALPGLRTLARYLFGLGPLESGDGEEEGLDYEVEYLKAMARSPGQPLVLTPPEGVPGEWTEP